MPKKKLITIIRDCLEEMKAQDTVILDIKDKSSIADYMVYQVGPQRGTLAQSLIKYREHLRLALIKI